MISVRPRIDGGVIAFTFPITTYWNLKTGIYEVSLFLCVSNSHEKLVETFLTGFRNYYDWWGDSRRLPLRW